MKQGPTALSDNAMKTYREATTPGLAPSIQRSRLCKAAALFEQALKEELNNVDSATSLHYNLGSVFMKLYETIEEEPPNADLSEKDTWYYWVASALVHLTQVSSLPLTLILFSLMVFRCAYH